MLNNNTFTNLVVSLVMLFCPAKPKSVWTRLWNKKLVFRYCNIECEI